MNWTSSMDLPRHRRRRSATLLTALVSLAGSVGLVGMRAAAETPTPAGLSVPAHPGDNRLLIDLSDVAVIGTVGPQTESASGETKGLSDTLVPVSVAQPIKGSLAGTVKVRQTGGIQSDGTIIAVSHMAALRPGEQVILFLKDIGDGTFYTIYGDLGAITEKRHDSRGSLVHNPRFDLDPASATVQGLCDSAQTGVDGFAHFAPWIASNGRHMVWTSTNPRVVVSYTSNLQSRASALTQAEGQWNQQGGNFQILDGGVTAADPYNGSDTLSTIGLGAITPDGRVAEARLQLTGLGGSNNSYQIAAFDVIFDQTRAWSGGGVPASYELDTVVVTEHEIGHGLGFAHVNDTNQKMYGCSATSGPSNRALGDGEQAGHRNFYPPNNFGTFMVDEAGAVYGLGGYGSWDHPNTTYQGGPNASNVIGYPTNKATDIKIQRPRRDGYYVLASNGGVFAYGGAQFMGSASGYLCPACTSPAMTLDPSGSEYWIVGSDGGVFSFPSGARFWGSAAGNFPAGAYGVGIARKPNADGYFIVNNLGQVYSYGPNPAYYGGGIPASAQPARAIETTTSGQGYWILGCDGMMYGFGDAGTVGGTGSNARQMSRDPLNNSVFEINANGTVGGNGFWVGNATGGTPWAAIAIQELPPAPDFSMSANPTALTIKRGQSGSSNVTVSSNDTFWNSVTFSQSGAPSGVGVSISPNPVTLRPSSSANTTVTFTVPTTYVGSGWTSTVTGCGGGVCRQATIAIVVPVV